MVAKLGALGNPSSKRVPKVCVCVHTQWAQGRREAGGLRSFVHCLALLSWGRMPERNHYERRNHLGNKARIQFLSLWEGHWRDESRNAHEKLFNDHFTRPPLLGVFPGRELTLGLPRLPPSNGCTFQGRSPTERRTSVIWPQKPQGKEHTWHQERVSRQDTWAVTRVCGQVRGPDHTDCASLKAWLERQKLRSGFTEHGRSASEGGEHVLTNSGLQYPKGLDSQQLEPSRS